MLVIYADINAGWHFSQRTDWIVQRPCCMLSVLVQNVPGAVSSELLSVAFAYFEEHQKLWHNRWQMVGLT